MSLQLVHFSSWGGYRPTNQDAYCVRLHALPTGILAMLAVCDGMGGMNCGEVASSTLIDAFGRWFDAFAPQVRTDSLNPEFISREWHGIVFEKHRILQTYGRNHGWHVGTTLSVILLTKKRYFLMHVGDTRIYLSDMHRIKQLTKDQTLAMRELEMGRITMEEYKQDSRKNILLQCVGEKSVNPSFLTGKTPGKGAALLCSDGFYHMVEPEELFRALILSGEKTELRQRLLCVADCARSRGETDNMTCVALRWNNLSGIGKKLVDASGNTARKISESLACVSFMNGDIL